MSETAYAYGICICIEDSFSFGSNFLCDVFCFFLTRNLFRFRIPALIIKSTSLPLISQPPNDAPLPPPPPRLRAEEQEINAKLAGDYVTDDESGELAERLNEVGEDAWHSFLFFSFFRSFFMRRHSSRDRTLWMKTLSMRRTFSSSRSVLSPLPPPSFVQSSSLPRSLVPKTHPTTKTL